MRMMLMAVTSLCLGSALLACNQNPAQTPEPQLTTTSGPESTSSVAVDWSLKFQATCVEGISVEACAGAHGFTLNSAGHYWVGGPNGSVIREGSLPKEEFDEFLQIIRESLGSEEQPSNLELSGEEQTSELGVKGQNDVITLSRLGGNPVTIIRTQGSDLFFKLKTEEGAISLHSALRKMVEQYTQADVCTQGLAAAGNLIASLQACSVDADCGYYDQDLNPLKADGGDFIVLESCKKVSSPAVANNKAFEERKNKLLQIFDLLVSTCESTRLEGDGNCLEKTYALKGGAAVCQQGVCKANPSLLGQAVPRR